MTKLLAVAVVSSVVLATSATAQVRTLTELDGRVKDWDEDRGL